MARRPSVVWSLVVVGVAVSSGYEGYVGWQWSTEVERWPYRLTDADEPPRAIYDSSALARSEPSSEGIATIVRPVATRVAPGDPIELVLHWPQPDDRDALRRGTADVWRRRVDVVATMESLRLTVTSPDGRARTVVLDPEFHFIRPRDLSWELYWVDALLLELRPHRLQALDAFDEIRDAAIDVPLELPGVHTIGVTGQLHWDEDERRQPTPFAVGPVPVTRVAGILGRAELAAIAVDAIRRRFPIPGGAQLELDRWVLEDASGRRILRFEGAAPPELLGASTILYEAALDPDGSVRTLGARPMNRCIAAGTPVATRRGEIDVERLRPGDVVWGYDPVPKRCVEVVVRAVSCSTARRLVRLGRLVATPEHPVLARGSWVKAGAIVRGQRLHGFVGTTLATPVREEGEAVVYDLQVDAPHTYFAGGILVHNKTIFERTVPEYDFLWPPGRRD